MVDEQKYVICICIQHGDEDVLVDEQEYLSCICVQGIGRGCARVPKALHIVWGRLSRTFDFSCACVPRTLHTIIPVYQGNQLCTIYPLKQIPSAGDEA